MSQKTAHFVSGSTVTGIWMAQSKVDASEEESDSRGTSSARGVPLLVTIRFCGAMNREAYIRLEKKGLRKCVLSNQPHVCFSK